VSGPTRGSILLRRGIEFIKVLEREMREWMEEHEFESVEQLKGSMSQKNCPDPCALSRLTQRRTPDSGRFLAFRFSKFCKAKSNKSGAGRDATGTLNPRKGG
jgi:hypothetical protein